MPEKDLPHLPLPGEKLTRVYSHRQRRTRPSGRLQWVWNFAPPVLLVLGIALVSWLWLITRTPATIVINGQPQEIRTHRRTVGGAARGAGINLNDAVFINPEPETRLVPESVITVAILRPVTIHVDGVNFSIPTTTLDPHQIVEEAGIALNEGDTVQITRSAQPTASEVAANPALVDVPAIPREVTVKRARTLIVNEVTAEGTTRVSVLTAETTLDSALLTAGYTLYEADIISEPLDTPVTPNLEITIERALPLVLHVDGVDAPVRTHAESVQEMLKERGIALQERDYVIPASDALISPDMDVHVVRVTYESVIDEVDMPFQTTYIPNPDMALDELVEVQEGTPGVLNRQTQVRYEDGAEVSRIPQGEWVAGQPEARVVAYGTKIILRTEVVDGVEITYWRKLRMLATSYSPLTAGSKQPGDPFFGLSATGAEVVRGIVATDPRVVPLGTNLYVPGYGTGKALDIGGAVKGMRIDLGYDDTNLVLWNNWTEVYLTPPVPAPDQMVWILPEVAQEVSPEGEG